ncbi:carboxypeptidase-like regulatory domain-containing protein [Hymenobacter rigui]|uniref:Carboxypeptidase regulatory-like domain-containing protein n=1 Tax=Hymenobacter rigui TaxID=334424 RepID=A0A428KM68_9BACT|nr:carboxypeptidase-like regulatory domain-containing protein [Hymenobacter rigui]RSK47540.1 carboxypeptidase regulatory-like domain-containing protein [Hymenobacter rigui]
MFFTYALRCALFLLGCVLFLVTGSCSRDDAVAPLPAEGTVQGQLMPARAASAVTLTAADGRTSTATPDAAGTFAFPGLAPGTYSLTAAATSSYNAPAPVAVVVKARETHPVTLTFSRSFRVQGTVSWQQGGVQYSATRLSGQFTDKFFSLEGVSAPDASGNLRSVSVVLSNLGGRNAVPFQGAGFYALGLSEYTFALARFRTAAGAMDEYYTGAGGSSVSHVLVARYDYGALSSAGTFEFTAIPSLYGTGTASPYQTITNGRFDITF